MESCGHTVAMRSETHPITRVIDVLSRDSENQCCIPRLLKRLLDFYDLFPRSYRRTYEITSPFATAGTLVKFQCKVRSVVQTHIPAFSDKLLLFRPESTIEGENVRMADVVSLGCTVLDDTAVTTIPIVVKVFHKCRNIQKGHRIEVLGFVSYMPSFNELVRGSEPIRNMLEHSVSNPNPPGVRRIHAIRYTKIPRFDDDTNEDTTSGMASWCVLQ